MAGRTHLSPAAWIVWLSVLPLPFSFEDLFIGESHGWRLSYVLLQWLPLQLSVLFEVRLHMAIRQYLRLV
jgi:hypothetical protein